MYETEKHTCGACRTWKKYSFCLIKHAAPSFPSSSPLRLVCAAFFSLLNLCALEICIEWPWPKLASINTIVQEEAKKSKLLLFNFVHLSSPHLFSCEKCSFLFFLQVDGKKVPRDEKHPHYPFNDAFQVEFLKLCSFLARYNGYCRSVFCNSSIYFSFVSR